MHTKILTLFFLTTSLAFSQRVNWSKKVFSCDEIARANDFARVISLDTATKVKLLCSPRGSGEAIEVQGAKRGTAYFAREHHIVWFKLVAARSGQLGFRIVPDSEHDDYDFLVFKSEGPGTIDKIKSKQLQPIRSNLARTKDTNGGQTGLLFGNTDFHIGPGPNKAYSAPLSVQKGEVYYLVLDNVYDDGRGALLYFDYFELRTIRGVVKDSNNRPIKAEVTVENSKTGETYASTSSDSITGKFMMTVPYDFNPSIAYVVSAYANNFFFMEELVESDHIKYDSSALLKLYLPRLTKGQKIRLNHINFVGNSPAYLPSAKPSLRRLYKVLKKNPNLKIHIEGHTNGCTNGVVHAQQLSENRALTVKNYLLKRNIDPERMTTEGLSCQFMLFPSNSSAREQSMNRRVEILIRDL